MINKNKKILISIIIAVVIIIIVAVIFVLIGMNDKNNKKDNSKIKFDSEESSANNISENVIKNEIEPEIGDDVDEFYINAVEKFISGYMNEDDMKDFLDNCIDVKAYTAYEKTKGKDEKFLEEYEAIEDDSEEINKVSTSFKQLPKSYKIVMNFIEAINNGAMDSMINETNKTSNSTNNTSDTDDNTTNTTNNEIPEFSEEDKEMKLVSIENPIKSNGDKDITSVDFTIAFLAQEVKLTMIFYDDIVIYICDENKTSVIDSSINDSLSNSGFELNDSEDEE